jgi:hypothetical protein
MGFWRRRRATAPPGSGREDPRAEDAAARETLARIVNEAVLLQDLTEDILAGIRQRRSLAELAGPGGALTGRFIALRAAVPEPADPQLRVAARTLREALDHHAYMLSSSLDLLGDLQPERVREQIDKLDGLGAPAQRVCGLQRELS